MQKPCVCGVQESPFLVPYIMESICRLEVTIDTFVTSHIVKPYKDFPASFVYLVLMAPIKTARGFHRRSALPSPMLLKRLRINETEKRRSTIPSQAMVFRLFAILSFPYSGRSLLRIGCLKALSWQPSHVRTPTFPILYFRKFVIENESCPFFPWQLMCSTS